jgi:DNA-binding response OmpR family regulator
MKARLLYVEDDESLGFVTRDHLELQGYQVVHCADGPSALIALREGEFDLCLLDVMLPGIDGFSLAEEIRRKNADVPILFLTAKSLKEDRIRGLRLGADDYVTKPFSIEELILRIEVFLRRSRVSGAPKDYYQIGQYEFDYANLELRISDEVKRLTQREADLLRFLWKNNNQVVKRSSILETVWGEDDYFLGRSLDVFISRLRKYLKHDERIRIENIHGVGFCMQA